MEMPKLDSIRIIRKKLGWSQADLAKAVGVSQSMINKIEKGEKFPSYDTAQKIFRILDEATKDKTPLEGIARDISTKEVESIDENDIIEVALKKLGNNFDQIPVLDKEEKCVGTITLRQIIKHMNEPGIKTKRVKSYMLDPLPIISENESLSHVQKILEAFDAVLTQNQGKISGIITRSDLIKKVFNFQLLK